ncbi:poly (ADP-ribose) polymerase, putative [Bodo saltans]|uniref:Poly (ADP-ribose) polymerase, putative n=1 Tax=Bodo saltans TaxID=75058 RepID=A0A0S4J969_BODSA|nr:poly (ADP-ribose) polymerase, putative [Bodo saltans]|eukprot:CUG86046.1 poly (ADP-ribose) polymerase, putative [Bodo saltans]
MVMDGVDTMSKMELIILCEKHKLDGGKTVASMKYALKKFFEDNDEPDAKKLKVDPAATSAAPPTVCAYGESCPNLHSITHRLALKHGGEYRDVPIKCRDGMGCSQLRDKEHLKKYAHDDDLGKVCKLAGDCPELHVYSHRMKFEHPGFRAQPFVCRNGASCATLHDKNHLYKYAHDIAYTPAAGAAFPSASSLSSSSSILLTTPSVSSISVLHGAGMSLVPESSLPAPPTPAVPVTPTSAATPTSMPAVSASGKSLDDFPLASAVDAVLTPMDKNSEEFWELEEKFLAHLQGRNEDYVEKRIKKGKKPIRFVLIGAEKISNPLLEARFEIKKNAMTIERSASGDAKECRERVSFHGTHPKNVKSIVKTGLLRFQHPLNPCKQQVDDGYFGTNKKGIYVSRYADYTLKYSNRVAPVEPGDEVKTIMFRTMPGKSKHIEKLVGGIDPTVGYDSHSSPTFLEWYLFDEAQCCPQYVLLVKAMEDTRTAADDE